MYDLLPGPSTAVHPPEIKSTSDTPEPSPTTADQANRFDPRGISGPDLARAWRHAGWARDRKRVYDALKRTGQSISRIVSFSTCGEGAYVLKSDGDPPAYRVAGSSCHDRFCTPCATERSRTIAQNVIDHIGKQRCRFVTLTVSEGATGLAPAVDLLYESFRKLQRTRFWRQRVTGGVGFLELKWSTRSDRWHPHLHLLTHGKYIQHKQLSDTWKVCSGGSYIVHITLAGGAERVAKYVTKYASKPLSAEYIRDPDLLDEAITVLRGRRMCCTWGGWRGVLLVDHPDEEAWTNLGPLADFIVNAARGDVEARAILHQINGHSAEIAIELAAPFARPPPPPPTPRITAQPLLFETALRPWQMETGRCT